uniref:BZIP domain-containing protein n=1 Tax=Acrobeloides nanus TaxID=290746 RepID=A0A914DQC9_9BILA
MSSDKNRVVLDEKRQSSFNEAFFDIKPQLLLSTPNSQQTHATTTTENLGPSTSQLNMQTSHEEYMLADVNPMSTQDQSPEVSSQHSQSNVFASPICVTPKSGQCKCFCFYCPIMDVTERIISANQLYSHNRLCLDECCKHLINQPSQHNQPNAFALNFLTSVSSPSNAMPYNQLLPPPEQQHLSPSQTHLSNSGQYFPASCNTAAYNPPMTPQYNPTYPSSSTQIGYSQSHQQTSNMPSRISNGLLNQDPGHNDPNMAMKLHPNNPVHSTSSSNCSTPMLKKVGTILSISPVQQIKKKSRGQKDPVKQNKKHREYEKKWYKKKKTIEAQTLDNSNLILEKLHEKTESNQEIQKSIQEMQKSIQGMQKDIQETQKSFQEALSLFKAYFQQNPMLSTPNSQQTHATTTAENLGLSTSQLNMQAPHGEDMLVDENPLSSQERPEVHVPDHGHPSEEFTLVASLPNAYFSSDGYSKDWDIVGVDSGDMDSSTTSLNYPVRTKSKSTLDLNQEFFLPNRPQAMDISLSNNMAQLSTNDYHIGCKYGTRTPKRQHHDFGFEYGLHKFKSTGDLTSMELPKLSWQTSISLDTFEFMRNSSTKWRLNNAQRIYTAMNPKNSSGARLPSMTTNYQSSQSSQMLNSQQSSLYSSDWQPAQDIARNQPPPYPNSQRKTICYAQRESTTFKNCCPCDLHFDLSQFEENKKIEFVQDFQCQGYDRCPHENCCALKKPRNSPKRRMISHLNSPTLWQNPDMPSTSADTGFDSSSTFDINTGMDLDSQSTFAGEATQTTPLTEEEKKKQKKRQNEKNNRDTTRKLQLEHTQEIRNLRQEFNSLNKKVDNIETLIQNMTQPNLHYTNSSTQSTPYPNNHNQNMAQPNLHYTNSSIQSTPYPNSHNQNMAQPNLHLTNNSSIQSIPYSNSYNQVYNNGPQNLTP